MSLAHSALEPNLIPTQSVPLGKISFDVESIIEFAQLYDPYPFHLSEEAGKDSILGGLAASGWQSVALSVPRVVTNVLGAQNILKSMGARDIRWPRPILKGDTIEGSAKVINWSAGTMQTVVEVAVNYRNQRDEDVGSVTLIFALHTSAKLENDL